MKYQEIIIYYKKEIDDVPIVLLIKGEIITTEKIEIFLTKTIGGVYKWWYQF